MSGQCELEGNSPSPQKISQYLGAIILGMNDAIIEMSGALAGFTIALSNNRLIILAGITTGAAATLSMACAEFMAEKVDARSANPYISASCTGVTYILVVALLLLPYFFISNPGWALFAALFIAVMIIFIFTFAVSKVKKTPFLRYFYKMTLASFVVASIAFFISWMAESFWGVDL